ncbi:MAG: response regulator [Acidimicrobiales bacterium]
MPDPRAAGTAPDPAVPAGGDTATVLVVDDEPQIRRALRTNLTVRGYRVLEAGDGRDALTAVADHRPDVVLLDLGLPGLDGIEVLHGLRGWSEVPVIVLTVRDRELDKVEALDAGADDYVTKPFGMNELLARLRAQLRRARVGHEVPDPVVTTDHFTIDLARGQVSDHRGEPVHLTPKEWGIVACLARRPDQLILQGDLLREVWGPQYGDEGNYLRVFMAQIRTKLEPSPDRPRYFVTEPGIGYRLEQTDAGSATGRDPKEGDR